MKETIVKIHKTKSWFFEKIKLTNLWPDSPRKKERNQINKIRNEKEEVTTDNEEIQRIMRLLRVPWTARRSNQSILKEISPGYSLEGLMLKLKLQYFGHLMRRVDSFEKTLMLGGIGGRRRRG